MIVAADAALWDQQYDLPLLERLGPAQDEIIAHVAQVNASIGVAAKPASTEVHADFHAGVGAAIGAGGNRFIGKKIIGNARKAFGPPPPNWPAQLRLLPTVG